MIDELKEVRDAIDDSIRGFMQAVNNDLTVIGWVVTAACMRESDDSQVTRYLAIMPLGQPYHASLGLICNAKIDMSRVTPA